MATDERFLEARPEISEALVAFIEAMHELEARLVTCRPAATHGRTRRRLTGRLTVAALMQGDARAGDSRLSGESTLVQATLAARAGRPSGQVSRSVPTQQSCFAPRGCRSLAAFRPT